jgi:hypothetical protein
MIYSSVMLSYNSRFKKVNISEKEFSKAKNYPRLPTGAKTFMLEPGDKCYGILEPNKPGSEL